MSIFQVRSLQQKALLFFLSPTFLLLSATGLGGFFFAQNTLLTQWSEVVNAKLQRAAHLIDMRIDRPVDLLQQLKFSSGAGMAHITLRYTVEQLEKLDGVLNVTIDYPYKDLMMPAGQQPMHSVISFLDISDPRYSLDEKRSAVKLIADISDAENMRKGTIIVTVLVSDLLEKVTHSGWWEYNQTMIVDKEGNIISQANDGKGNQSTRMNTTFGKDSPLEEKTLAALNEKPFGTIFGNGNPPKRISGFYNLSNVPWYLVVMAPGDIILKPILKFSFSYGLLFIVSISIITLFIRSMIKKITKSIQNISFAAEQLADGRFGPPIDVHGQDEISELTRSFNTMTNQLRHRVELQEAMDIAREMQQNFLPNPDYTDNGIAIYGFCRYSQETGGDFYDYIFSSGGTHLGVVIGDVVGHGIGAALLMASVRAIVRSSQAQYHSPAQIITHANSVLCNDTEENLNFVTLFYLLIDRAEKRLEWVRAGHDPALIFYPERAEQKELTGKGVAVGIDRNIDFKNNTLDITAERQLIVLCSDGLWEAENDYGQRFGKERLIAAINTSIDKRPKEIVEQLNEEITSFLGSASPQDDITLVVIEIDGRKLAV